MNSVYSKGIEISFRNPSKRIRPRWIPQQRREQRSEASRDEANREELISKKESVEFNLWGVILGFSVLSSLLVYKLKFRQ